ncbi:MAG: hypothetical protein SFX18_15750 [Pirellulales bacterium]|nr:hypothetical protein [Pirellulales bacterium]
MSPELTILDELLGGDLHLGQALALFGQKDKFVRAILFMLDAGEIRLLDVHGNDVPRWQRQDVLSTDEQAAFRISITNKGGARIA